MNIKESSAKPKINFILAKYAIINKRGEQIDRAVRIT
jgi:hypothetical protein